MNDPAGPAAERAVDGPVETPANVLPLAAAIATAVCFDLCIYRGGGYAGWAVLLITCLATFLLATHSQRRHVGCWISGAMLLVIALRMLWLGGPFQIVCGLLLLPVLGMSANGLVPYIPDAAFYGFQTIFAGGVGLAEGLSGLHRPKVKASTRGVLAIALPVFAVVVFSLIFIAANPDLATSVRAWAERAGNWLRHAFRNFDFSLPEFITLSLITWLTLGFTVPLVKQSLVDMLGIETSEPESPGQPAPSSMYAPFRNTLVAVIALFAGYLIFEFRTLWFREFPKGFYYAGYAHQGAAWLTFALALATFMLSAIFQRGILLDHRHKHLKQLAWIWSGANFVLALAVYNRLFIYIDFNGMTRMRVLGLFGITTVVVGFIWTVSKIIYQKGFFWLIQRDLWTLACALYLLAITPVDWFVHQFNVNQILSGNLAPAVQITEHDVDVSGWRVLHRLVNCEDPTIREGIRAKLAGFYFEPPLSSPNRQDSYSRSAARRSLSESDNLDENSTPSRHWTAFQYADRQLQETLSTTPNLWTGYDNVNARSNAWGKFKDYAYQWY